MNKKIFTTAIFLLGLGTSIFAQTADIYMAGWENGKVTLWKNGVATYLTSPSEDDNWACGVYASGNDVYVAGTESGRVVIWKNGVANYLTDGSKYSEIFSMSVSNGNICVAGYEEEEDNTSYYSTAKLWKNGESIDLTGGSIYSEARSVFASGDDVYVAGYDQPDNTDIFPKLWKNGKAIDFAADLKNNSASAVFVSGNDVYVALEDHRYIEDGQVTAIKLWKNGEVLDLAEVSGYSQISSMFVSGNDVYVGGDGFFKLWRNGAVTDVADIISATVRSIYVSGNNVYATIEEYAGDNVNGYYWKNGEKTLFSTNGFASSIFLASPNANIPEIKSADIKIYPNPTKDKVYIEIESNIKLYNMHGMLLQETFGKEIDLSDYLQGIYFLQVEGKMIKVVKR
jgi:hypothetical protein